MKMALATMVKRRAAANSATWLIPASAPSRNTSALLVEPLSTRLTASGQEKRAISAVGGASVPADLPGRTRWAATADSTSATPSTRV